MIRDTCGIMGGGKLSSLRWRVNKDRFIFFKEEYFSERPFLSTSILFLLWFKPHICFPLIKKRPFKYFQQACCHFLPWVGNRTQSNPSPNQVTMQRVTRSPPPAPAEALNQPEDVYYTSLSGRVHPPTHQMFMQSCPESLLARQFSSYLTSTDKCCAIPVFFSDCANLKKKTTQQMLICWIQDHLLV